MLKLKEKVKCNDSIYEIVAVMTYKGKTTYGILINNHIEYLSEEFFEKIE